MSKFKPLDVDISVLPEWQQKEVCAHLQAWFNTNEVRDTMIWKDSYTEQFVFVRDQIMNLFRDNVKTIDVISEHTSKSIKLPVYHVELIDGTELVMRHNFYDWKISIDAAESLAFPTRLFNHPDQHIPSIYCEGFNNTWVFPHYDHGSTKFTVELSGTYRVFTFLFLLNEQLFPE